MDVKRNVCMYVNICLVFFSSLNNVVNVGGGSDVATVTGRQAGNITKVSVEIRIHRILSLLVGPLGQQKRVARVRIRSEKAHARFRLVNQEATRPE